jgi:hypothetical protein
MPIGIWTLSQNAKKKNICPICLASDRLDEHQGECRPATLLPAIYNPY